MRKTIYPRIFYNKANRAVAQRSSVVPSLEAFKARLDGALGSLNWLLAVLPMVDDF